LAMALMHYKQICKSQRKSVGFESTNVRGGVIFMVRRHIFSNGLEMSGLES